MWCRLCINKEKIWGLLVVIEELTIRQDVIYEKVARELQINIDSFEYDWLRNHIKVVSLSNIENFLLYKQELIKELKWQEDNGQPGDFALSAGDKKIEESKDYIDFKKYTQDLLNDFIKEAYKTSK